MPPKSGFKSTVVWLTVTAASLAASAAPSAPTTSTESQSQHRATSRKLTSVPFTQVKIDDAFWKPRIETNRTVSLPHSIEMLKKAGNLKNLELAKLSKRDGYEGPFFIDSDLYKAVEAISCSLATHPDPALESQLDEIISAIADAQQPDGYLNTWVQVVAPDQRWKNLRDKHELYCAGHLIEAAVAHYNATGKRTLLDVAIKFADYIDSIFGDEPGKRMGYPGHEEIELALFKLWHATGEQRYYDLAKFFLDHRGTGFFATEHNINPAKYNGEYWQDNVSLRDTQKIVGHAVRAVYLLSGATDLATTTHDPALVNMLERVWDNTTNANMYVTGGIGSSAKNEGFTHDYDLPNFAAYQETCASVAMIRWNQRMNMMTGEAKYADGLERALYNGFLAGVSLDGKKYFYVNPLASRGRHHRSEWYSCACCPPNVTRTLAQLGGFLYATSPGTLWVNQYVGGSVETRIDETTIGLTVKTDYPWSGVVSLKPQLESAREFELRLRIPAWCENISLAVNGESTADPARDNGYITLHRKWLPGDEIVLNLAMPVQHLAADDRVIVNHGKRAIRRGPVVYCLEEADQSAPIQDIAIAATADLTPEKRPEMLGGITVLIGQGQLATSDSATTFTRLYAPLPPARPVDVTLIPYYAWDNRDAGDMAVWIPTAPPTRPFDGPEDIAKVSMSFIGNGGNPDGCRDGFEIVDSLHQYGHGCHWWPHKGGTEWVQYSWENPQSISSSRIYWLDDTGAGECRIPKSWHIEYRDGDNWKPVDATSQYPSKADQWCEVQFSPVKTRELRLVVEMQPGFAAGVHEWQL